MWWSSFYHPFQKIFFYHLFYFLPSFAGKWFVVFQLHVVGEGGGVEDGAPWVSCASAGDFAIEDLAKHIEERQELLEAAHSADGEQQVPRLPAQRSPWVVLLRIFLQKTERQLLATEGLSLWENLNRVKKWIQMMTLSLHSRLAKTPASDWGLLVPILTVQCSKIFPSRMHK